MKQAIPMRRAGRRRPLLKGLGLIAVAGAVAWQLGLPGTLAPWGTQPVQASEAHRSSGRQRPAKVVQQPALAAASRAITATAPATPASPVSLRGPRADSPVAGPGGAAVIMPPAALVGGTVWTGTVGSEAYVRGGPSRSAPRIGTLQPGAPVQVVGWVSGEEVEKENTTWADLGDGRYVFSTLLRSRPLAGPPPPPADAPSSGRWIDVNLLLQVATAYDGATPLRSALVSTGRPGWETPVGTFEILRRVPKETMDGSTLIGQGPGGRGASYRVENVRWTQYFTPDGAAIHENYWRNPATFGIPGSHGCIGLTPADAAWFWDFAAAGTPIVVH